MGVRIGGVKIVEMKHDDLQEIKGGDTSGYYHETSSINALITIGGASGYVLSARSSGTAPVWAEGAPTSVSGSHGAVQYRDASVWVSLAPANSGYIFVTRDSGYSPEWRDLGTASPTRVGSYFYGINEDGTFYWAEGYPGVSGLVFTSQGSGEVCTWETPSAGVVDHEALIGLLGGTSGMHYHVTSSIDDLLVYPGVSGTVFTSHGSGEVCVWVSPTVDHEVLTGLLGSTSGMHYHVTSSINILLTSGATGDFIYYDGADWARLNASNSGYVLETRGTESAPIWVESAAVVASARNLDGGNAGSTYGSVAPIDCGGAS